jgi:hypothetical protein
MKLEITFDENDTPDSVLKSCQRIYEQTMKYYTESKVRYNDIVRTLSHATETEKEALNSEADDIEAYWKRLGVQF